MKFRNSAKRKITAHVDMTPLIDVVFQLLVFFMLSATFVVQSSVPIEIPEAEGTSALEQKDISITLAYGEGGPDDLGPIYVDNVEMKSLDELTQVLSARHTENPDIVVLIRTDARVDSGRLVQILGITHSLGIEDYGISAKPQNQ